MHYNCLIVDDELALAKMTQEYFLMFDVSCECVGTASDCAKFLSENEVDLILMDINLGEESGFNLCRRIRENSDIPILFISARQSDDDVLIALNIGGDDYIKKPVSLSVLLAKVKVTLKRRDGKTSRPLSYTIDNGEICLEEETMRVRCGGRTVQLKAKEFKLLQCLYENRNVIVTKEQLFNNVWGDSFFSDGTLNVHIRRLREKLEDNPNEPKLIKTIWGTGYMLEL